MAAFLNKLLCFLSLIVCSDFAPSKYAMNKNTLQLNDRMGREEKQKMLKLCDDLLKESVLRVRQILDIRTEHELYTSFAVGAIIGRMREKYRFMVEAYRDMYDAHRERTIILPPGIIGWIPIFLFINLELMRTLELEIDKLVDIIVDEAETDFKNDHSIAGAEDDEKPSREKQMMENRTRTREGGETPGSQDGAGYGSQGIRRRRLRSREEIIREERQKSLIRQMYLMKRIGRPLNSTTTMKRFLRHWPVEDTWSLDKYNQFY